MATDYVVGLYEGVSLFEAIKAPRGSVKFTNTSGQLRLTAGPSSATAWTFTTWVKITNDTNFYALWLSLQGASSTYLETGFDISGNGFEVNDLATERSLGVTATVGTWYFTSISMGASGAVTMFTGPEGGKLTKYTTTLTNLSLPLADALLGGELSYEHLDGALAQTRFWNAVLSDAEILAEFYSDSPVRTSNIGGHWKLENTSSKLTDSSGASNTLSNPQGTGTYAYLAGPAIGPAPFGAPFENVAIAETIDAVYTAGSGGSYTGNVNETVTVSESLGVVDNAIVGVAETDNLSESLGSVRGAIAGLAETVTLSESTAAAYAAVVPTPETVSLSEALGTQSDEASALAETVTLSESMSGGSAFTAATSETVTLSESTAATYGAIASPAESVSLSESLGSQSDEASSLSETVTLSESLAGGSEFSGALSETVSVSDSLSAQAGTAGSVSDTVSASESLGAVAATAGSVSEDVATTEGGTFTYSGVVSPSESVVITETVDGTQGGGGGTSYNEGLSESVTVGDAVAVAYSATQGVADRVDLSKRALSEMATTDLHLVAEDWTPGSNWVSRVGGFTANLVGSLAKSSLQEIERNEINGFGSANYFRLPANSSHEINNSSQMTWEFVVRTTTGGGILMGRYATPFGGGFDLSLFSNLLAGIYNDAGDNFQRLHQGLATFGNGLHVLTFVLDTSGDTLTTYYDGQLDSSTSGHTGAIANTTPVDFFLGNSNGNDQAWSGGIVEVLRHREALSEHQIADRYELLSTVASLGAHTTPTESVTVADVTTAAMGTAASVSEMMSLSDSAALAQVLAQGLAESLSLAESTTALAALSRSLSETVTISEAAATIAGWLTSVAESLSVSDAVALAQVLANALAETVALAEAMIGYIPRVLVTELGDAAAVKTATISAGPTLAVETGAPTAVISAVTEIQGAT